MTERDLQPLHGLYQLIARSDAVSSERQLIAVAQLRRKPPPRRVRSESGTGAPAPGALEWVVGIAGAGKVDPEAKGRARERGPDDEWWEKSMPADEVTTWLQQAGGTHAAPSVLAAKLRSAWQFGALHVGGYCGPGAQHRGGIELVVEMSGNLSPSLVLSPCDSPPLSLESVLLKTIPAYNAAATRSQSPTGITSQPHSGDGFDYKAGYEKLLLHRDEAMVEKSTLESELHALRDRNKRARIEAKRHPRDGSAGPSQTASPSSTKPAIPGETHRATLRPGDPGYAGSRSRVGRITAADDFDPVSDSD
ncbi:hypothetical protein JCM8202_004285 [Rhodotorula sphaerocarpa]